MGIRRSVKHLALAIMLAAGLPLVGVVSVSAKTPYFTVEIDPAVPTAGQPFLVIVRTWKDADHSAPLNFVAPEALGGLLVARQPGGDSPDIAVPLLLREPDRFEASIILPAGEWTIIAFPDRAGWANDSVPVGYPDTIPLTVREPALDLTGFVIALVVIATALMAIAQVRRPRFNRGPWRPRRPVLD